MNTITSEILQILDNSKLVACEFDQDIQNCEFMSVAKSRIAASLLDQVHEHHESICILVENHKIGSAFALLRPTLDCFVRGMWFGRCASESEVTKFLEKDSIEKNFGALISEIEDVFDAKSALLSNLKAKFWAPLSSYTHGGVLPVLRRIKSGEVQQNYSSIEVAELLYFSKILFFLSSVEIFCLCGQDDLAQKWSLKYQEFVCVNKKAA